ncbi:MAG: Flp pilus assembly complex ATPase component TadA [Clostridiales bacterium]|nr:Flp pilus assembly complex ATPase component TadA [Clostridiales bacterium]
MEDNKKRLGELLVEAGKITKKDIDEVLKDADPKDRLGELLIKAGKVTQGDIEDALISQKQLDVAGVKKKKEKLGEILIGSGKVTQEQIDTAMELKSGAKERLGEILVLQGIISKEEIEDIVEKQTGVKTVDLDKYNYVGDAYKYIPKSLAKRLEAIPLEQEGNTLKVAMLDPFDLYSVDNVQLYTGFDVIPVFASKEQIDRKIEEFYGLNNETIAQKSSDYNNVTESLEQKVNIDDVDNYKTEVGTKRKKKKIGEILIESGKVTQEQIEVALQEQKKTKEKLGEILVNKGIITQQEINDAVFNQTGIKSIDLDKNMISRDVYKLIPERLAKKYKAIPIKKEQMMVTVAMVDPFDIYAIDDISLYTGLKVVPVFGSERQIEKRLVELYRTDNIDVAVQEYKKEKKEKEQEEEEEEANAEVIDNAPIVKLLNNIVNEAIRMRASDIHIEPSETSIRVRYRVDGELRTAMTLEKAVHQSLIARIKILSRMNIAEKRMPQDGAFTVENKTGSYDLRTNILPATYGEKACIRILDKNTVIYKKSELGFFEDEAERFDSLLGIHNGLILVTGPTGSGKSTTMYTALSELNDDRKNIVTAEDPVEIKVNGINQVAINEKIGLTYVKILRAFLRQDPDIIMIGEIRDAETAQMAVRASITGHIVLSTLHTNSAAGTIMRLQDMGIEPYLIATSLKGVIAQRLVKRVCPDCIEEYEADEEEKKHLGIDKKDTLKLVRGKGCLRCSNTGYFGRIAIAEIMEINRVQKELIIQEAQEEDIDKAARENGMKTMDENIKRAVLEKKTSFEEYIKFVKFRDLEVK